MRLFSKLVLAATALVLSACAANSNLPPAPAVAEVSNTADSGYVIGPGDSLNIFVWHNTDLTRQIPVRPDGRISMPLIGDLTAAGKTPDQLASELQTALVKYIQNPLVTVIPTSFVGMFTRQIRVVGEAVQPKALPYRASMTALDVMIEVGGLTKYADGDHAVLIRQVNGAQKSYQVHLDSLVRDGEVSQNVEMVPGDVLIIPQRYF